MCVYIYMYICMYMCVYIYIYIYTYFFIYCLIIHRFVLHELPCCVDLFYSFVFIWLMLFCILSRVFGLLLFIMYQARRRPFVADKVGSGKTSILISVLRSMHYYYHYDHYYYSMFHYCNSNRRRPLVADKVGSGKQINSG